MEMEIDIDTILTGVAAVLVLAYLIVSMLEDFNDQDPPHSGWCIYTDEEHVKRLNKQIQDTRMAVQ